MSGTNRRLLIAAVVTTLALGACGSGATGETDSDVSGITSAPAATATGNPVDVPVPQGDAQALPNPSPGSYPKLGGGANAAPSGADIVNSYDKSPEAATTFSGWWKFELQTVPDRDKDPQQVYWDGTFVCMSRASGAGQNAIIAVLDQNLNYDTSGAAGVYAAALRALCPQFNPGWDPNIVDVFGGYNTYFDEEIKRAHTEIVTKAPQQGINVSGTISLFSVGLVAKYACNWLNVTNPNIGLREYLQQNAQFLDLANPKYHVIQFTQLVVAEGVFRICFNHHSRLNFSWYQ
jgi:hypothetical protein